MIDHDPSVSVEYVFHSVVRVRDDLTTVSDRVEVQYNHGGDYCYIGCRVFGRNLFANVNYRTGLTIIYYGRNKGHITLENNLTSTENIVNILNAVRNSENLFYCMGTVPEIYQERFTL